MARLAKPLALLGFVLGAICLALLACAPSAAQPLVQQHQQQQQAKVQTLQQAFFPAATTQPDPNPLQEAAAPVCEQAAGGRGGQPGGSGSTVVGTAAEVRAHYGLLDPAKTFYWLGAMVRTAVEGGGWEITRRPPPRRSHASRIPPHHTIRQGSTARTTRSWGGLPIRT